MSEIYDAAYAAIRSKVQSVDLSGAFESFLCNLGMGHAVEMVRARADEVLGEWQRPSILLRPRVYLDGDKYCAGYGDMPEGIHGFGDSIHEAMLDFDTRYYAKHLKARG